MGFDSMSLARNLDGEPRNIVKSFLKALNIVLEAYAKENNIDTNLHWPILQTFANIQNILPIESDIVGFIYIMETCSPVEALFEDLFKVHEGAGMRYLATALGVSSHDCVNGIASLRRKRLLDTSSFYRLTDKVKTVLAEDLDRFVFDALERCSSRAYLRLEDYQIDSQSLDHAVRLLTCSDDMPVHILLYGPPKSGKTSLAWNLAKTVGADVWSSADVIHDDEDDVEAILEMGVALSGSAPRRVAIIDDADKYLNREYSWEMPVNTKMFKAPGSRGIWVVNNPGDIDASARAYFTFNLRLPPLGHTSRLEIMQRTLAAHNASAILSIPTLERLAGAYPLAPDSIEASIRQAVALGDKTAHEVLRILEMSLKAGLELQGSVGQRELHVDPSFTLEAVNPDCDLPELLAGLERVTNRLRAGETGPGTRCTMLFYGPPGTGKTELARHLAGRLNMTCQIVKPNDIMDKYVGESEKNIARIFSEASRTNSLLIVDEADSFLYDRSMAVQSWEISAVNAFLTALEDFRGILICTSNRKAQMDLAVMRRFARKIAFSCATPDGAEALYRRVLAPLVKTEPTSAMVLDLRRLEGLTPGDFRAVADSLALADPDKLTHERMLKALRDELGHKSGSRVKRLGF